MNKQMRLQTDLEFKQREIMKLNKKYNVLMFRTKIRDTKMITQQTMKIYLRVWILLKNLSIVEKQKMT